MSVVFDGDDKSRFIITEPFDVEMPHHYIIIKDYNFWVLDSQNGC